jgi:SEL1 protein
MGIFLLEGDIGGLPRDYDRAFHYFRIAAETGDPTAISHLAYCYQMGYGTPSDNITAKALYEKAAGLESATAQTQLGIMYYYGWGVERDVVRAKKYFLQASDRNDAEAYLYLGRMAYSGIGTTKSSSKAREHFSNAASGGNLVALYNLGILSANGLGMKVSCTNAVTFYRKILEMSVLKTALITAYKYYARGLYDKALIHYELAADQGEVLAQINAAWLYEMGIGVKTLGGPNSAESDNAYKRKALEFYIRAAEQLSPEAHLKVGDFFYYGWSVPPDPELAYHYYRAASNLRNAQATFNLGWMHQYGIGIPKDYHLAKRYYDQAIEHNDVEAYFPSQLALTSLSLTQFTESIFSTGLIYGYAWDNLLIALLLFSLLITVTIRQVMLLG